MVRQAAATSTRVSHIRPFMRFHHSVPCASVPGTRDQEAVTLATPISPTGASTAMHSLKTSICTTMSYWEHFTVVIEGSRAFEACVPECGPPCPEHPILSANYSASAPMVRMWAGHDRFLIAAFRTSLRLS